MASRTYKYRPYPTPAQVVDALDDLRQESAHASERARSVLSPNQPEGE